MAAKKMSTTTVEHSGERHVGARQVSRCAAVRGGVRHAAMPCEGLIKGGPKLPHALSAPPRPTNSVY